MPFKKVSEKHKYHVFIYVESRRKKSDIDEPICRAGRKTRH